MPSSIENPFPEGAEVHRRSDIWCVTAGVPCQDWSVAGKRAGISGERSGLFFEFARILRELRPKWAIFENVPGLLSAANGRDFAIVLSTLAEVGFPSIAYRILDSQYFGVAQRRRRVYVVCGPRIGSAEAILFERESGSGDSEARGEAGKDTAYALAASVRGTGDGHGNAWNTTYAVTGNMRNRSQGPANYVAAPLTSGKGKTGNPAGRRCEDDFNLIARPITSTCGKRHDDDTDTLIAATLRESDGHHGRSSPRGDGCDNLFAVRDYGAYEEGLPTLRESGGDCGGGSEAVTVIQDVRGGTRDKTDAGQGIGIREGGPSYTLSKTEQHAVAFSGSDAINEKRSGIQFDAAREVDGAVRRHDDDGAPIDTDRMRNPSGVSEGLDDSRFPLLPKGLDSARYSALGNAVTTNVIEWIVRRMIAWEESAGL